MSTGGLPTIWELVAEAAGKLPEPFSRAALINWISARRPDVGIASIATHIQFATANSGSAGHNPFDARTPLLRRVDRGLYERYRGDVVETPAGEAPVRVVLVASAGAHGPAPEPVATLFRSPGFASARAQAEHSRLPVVRAQREARAARPRRRRQPLRRPDRRALRLLPRAPGASGWSRSSASGCSSRASPSRCTAASTSPSRCASRCPAAGRPSTCRSRAPGGSPSTAMRRTSWSSPEDPAAPAKGALHRLRTLVSGNRSSDGGGHSSPSGHATAS